MLSFSPLVKVFLLRYWAAQRLAAKISDDFLSGAEFHLQARVECARAHVAGQEAVVQSGQLAGIRFFLKDIDGR